MFIVFCPSVTAIAQYGQDSLMSWTQRQNKYMRNISEGHLINLFSAFRAKGCEEADLVNCLNNSFFLP